MNVIDDEWLCSGDKVYFGQNPLTQLALATGARAERVYLPSPAHAHLAALAPRMARLLLKHENAGRGFDHDACCPECGRLELLSGVPRHEVGCELGALCDELRKIRGTET